MSSTGDSNGSSEATATTATTTIKRSREELEQDLDAEQRAHKKTKTENEELKKANSNLDARLLKFETEQGKNGIAASPNGMTTPTKQTTKKSVGSTVRKYKALKGKFEDAQKELEAVEAEKLKHKATIERITNEHNVELGENEEEKNFLRIKIDELKSRVAVLDNILREISIRHAMVLLSQEIFRFVQKGYKDNPFARLPKPTQKHQPQLHEIPPELYEAPKAGKPDLRLTP